MHHKFRWVGISLTNGKRREGSQKKSDTAGELHSYPTSSEAANRVENGSPTVQNSH